MASGYLQSGANIDFSVSTVAVTLTGVTAGSGFYVVACWLNTTETLTSIVSDKDGAATLVNNPVTIGTAGRVAHGYILAGAVGGSTVFTATKSAAAGTFELHVFELSSVATKTDNIGNTQVNPGTSADAVTSTAITTSANGILVGASFDVNNTTVPNIGTGFTIASTGSIGKGEYVLTAAGGSKAITFTETEAVSQQITTAMSFAPAGGVGGATVQAIPTMRVPNVLFT